MKSVFILLMFFASFANAQTRVKAWKVTDAENFLKEAPTDVVVMSFWATFCKPCLAEIPSFIRTVKSAGEGRVSLVLVSLDLPSQFPKKIYRFAKKNGLDASLAWLNETDADYFCPRIDKHWSGSIPATLFVNRSTGVRKFFEQELSEEEFSSALEEVMSAKPPAPVATGNGNSPNPKSNR